MNVAVLRQVFLNLLYSYLRKYIYLYIYILHTFIVTRDTVKFVRKKKKPSILTMYRNIENSVYNIYIYTTVIRMIKVVQ